MSTPQPPSLPAGWCASEGAGGVVDLRVVSSGRRYVAVGAGVLATFFGWKTVVQWGVLPVAGIAPWLGLTLLLGLLAIWWGG